MTKKSLPILVGACAALLMTAPVHASIIGSIWENQQAAASNATPANVPGSTPDVTFEIAGTDIDFQSGGLYTIGEFLSSGGATILTGAGEAGNTLNNTIFNITGTVTVTNGETFTGGHDDGMTFIIGGTTVISAPGPTSFADTTNTYTGPSGNYAFQLVYGEVMGAPADLKISGLSLVTTPEPGTLAMGIGGILLALAGARRSRKA